MGCEVDEYLMNSLKRRRVSDEEKGEEEEREEEERRWRGRVQCKWLRGREDTELPLLVDI